LCRKISDSRLIFPRPLSARQLTDLLAAPFPALLSCRLLASRALLPEPRARVPEPDSRLKRLSPYVLAVVAALAMAGARLLLNPVLGNELPFITLFPAVFLAMWS
jgi:hypothetical protein